jgi:transcriptional regulator of arginine metabolism
MKPGRPEPVVGRGSTSSPRAAQRRLAIARILARREVGTQEALAAELRRNGFEVTQATLSRDLARLGARRAAHPSGGTRYELPTQPSYDLPPQAAGGGAMVVVNTHPGAASAVAQAIEAAQLPGVLGAVALAPLKKKRPAP